MNSKVTWAIIGVAALLGLGYLASRVGNIGARSARNGTIVPALTLSDPLVPGVAVAVHWTTSLGQETEPVVLKARSNQVEEIVGQGEFGAGQAMITIPCEFGGETIGVGLYKVVDASEQLITQQTVRVLPPGPDCLR